MLEKVSTADAPAAIGPYSQAIKAGGFVFTSGQIALDPATGNLVGQDITEQAEQVMKNLAAVLKAAGSSFENVVRTTCLLPARAAFGGFNLAYRTLFSSVQARSCVAVRELPKGALVEVEAVALLG